MTSKCALKPLHGARECYTSAQTFRPNICYTRLQAQQTRSGYTSTILLTVPQAFIMV